MKSMYEISREAMDIVSALEETGGELTPAIEVALRINQNELQEKSINYANAIEKLSNDLNYIDMKIKKYQQFKKTTEKIIQRLKETVVHNLQIYGIEKIETPTMKISIRRSEAVEVHENFHEDIYMIKKVTYTPDKTRLKEAIKRGQNIEGARIIENYNLQIK
jgi:hypothetical protein